MGWNSCSGDLKSFGVCGERLPDAFYGRKQWRSSTESGQALKGFFMVADAVSLRSLCFSMGPARLRPRSILCAVRGFSLH